jgi:hypothetical protein
MKSLWRGAIPICVGLCVLLPASWGQFRLMRSAAHFVPTNRLSGVGLDREEMSDLVLERRTDLMIESQTFGIMRDPQALAGAKRMFSPQLAKLFHDSAEKAGWPESTLQAIAYLESWGDSKAESPAGPRGIMQISEATARSMGLRVLYGKQYHITTETRKVKLKNGRTVARKVSHRTAYSVLVRDDRLFPERAVPAAARYLAGLEKKFGGRDWAIFAYHCGAGCVADFQTLVERARLEQKGSATVARVFFSASPVQNRAIYEAIQHHMERDYSPTYWFRIMRAEQLLNLYKSDPDEFTQLIGYYRNPDNPAIRAPHRLTVWLKPGDLMFRNCDDIRRDDGKHLVKAVDDPEAFGFSLRKSSLGADDLLNQEYYLQASPAAVGTLMYIAFETRRLYSKMDTNGKFVPLEVTSLVRPLDRLANGLAAKTEAAAHCTGQVFDVEYSNLPPKEREALQFVLDDLGWDGYLGFVEESPKTGTLHIGCAPSVRDFFARVFDEAMKGNAVEAAGQ